MRNALVARGLWPRRGGSGVPVRRAIAQPAPVARLWRDAVDPRGTLAERHLNGRGLALDDDLPMRVLRFHDRCPFRKAEDGKTLRCRADRSIPPVPRR